MDRNYLGVFGDSFADCSPKFGGWPVDLAQLLDMPLDVYSKPGTSVWYSYKNFIKNYKKYSHIVFVYTFPHRWPVLPERLQRWSWLIDKNFINIALGLNDKDREEMLNLVDIHKYIFDENYNNFVWQSVFRSVNKICKNNNIKIFNVLPFNSEHQNFAIMLDDKTNNWRDLQGNILNYDDCHGSCLTRLTELSARELRDIAKVPRLNYINTIGDIRGCHLNKSNNKAIAEIIAENFNNDTPKIIDSIESIEHKKMSFDPYELVSMIDEYEDIE